MYTDLKFDVRPYRKGSSKVANSSETNLAYITALNMKKCKKQNNILIIFRK